MVVADRRTKNPVRGGGQLAQRKKKFHNKKIGEVKEARERERERERERGKVGGFGCGDGGGCGIIFVRRGSRRRRVRLLDAAEAAGWADVHTKAGVRYWQWLTSGRGCTSPCWLRSFNGRLLSGRGGARSGKTGNAAGPAHQYSFTGGSPRAEGPWHTPSPTGQTTTVLLMMSSYFVKASNQSSDEWSTRRYTRAA